MPSLSPDIYEIEKIFGDHVKLEVIDFAALPVEAFDTYSTAIEAGDGPATLDALVTARRESRLHSDMVHDVGRLFTPGDVIEFRAVAPDGTGTADSLNWQVGTGEDRAIEFLRHHDGKKNLYVGVNPRNDALDGTVRAAKGADVAATRHVVLDLDFKSAPAGDPDWSQRVKELLHFGPKLIVNTGNGIHVWFGVNGTGDTNGLNTALRAAGSDAVGDAPRIMRLPGSINIPTASKRRRGAKYELAHAVALSGLAAKVWPLSDFQRVVLGSGGAGISVDPAESEQTSPHANSCIRPEAAPSLDLLRQLFAELPNQPGGPFESRDDWVAVAHAAKGASLSTAFVAEARDIFVEWSGTWGGEPDETARVWDTCITPHTGWRTLKDFLWKNNKGGGERVHLAEARAAFAGRGIEAEQLPLLAGITAIGVSSATLAPARAGGGVPAAIPPRQWLYGRILIRGHVSLLVAPGGVGKSSLAITEALAMASGRPLLGQKVHRPLRVWVWNGEDPEDELTRRVTAARGHHSLTTADLGGRLFMNSGRTAPISLARAGRDGIAVDRSAVEALISALTDEKIDVLVIDPLVTVHGVPENDNTGMNAVMGALREIADRCRCAVLIVHHVNKSAAAEGDGQGVQGSRGAGALIDAVRSARFLTRMTKDEAARFGIGSDLWRYFRIQTGKANLAPAEEAEWCRTTSVLLGNGTPEYPDGDSVGVVEAWVPPKASGLLPPGALSRVQAAIAQSPQAPRANEQADGWVGYLIAAELHMDIGAHGERKGQRTDDQNTSRAQVRRLISEWVKEDWLLRDEEGEAREKDGRATPVIRVGQRAPIDTDSTSPTDRPAGGEGDFPTELSGENSVGAGGEKDP